MGSVETSKYGLVFEILSRPAFGCSQLATYTCARDICECYARLMNFTSRSMLTPLIRSSHTIAVVRSMWRRARNTFGGEHVMVHIFQ